MCADRNTETNNKTYKEYLTNHEQDFYFKQFNKRFIYDDALNI